MYLPSYQQIWPVQVMKAKKLSQLFAKVYQEKHIYLNLLDYSSPSFSPRFKLIFI